MINTYNYLLGVLGYYVPTYVQIIVPNDFEVQNLNFR